jgi:hypothetical protein
LETGVLVLLLHCKFVCIVGDRSFSAAEQYRNIYSAAAALKLLSPTLQENLQCCSSTKIPVSNNTGTFTVQQQH